jgi:hypothetical protein
MILNRRFACQYSGYLLVAGTIIGLCHPLLYWHLFTGDAEIHLAYARNLLRGHPLQFNLNTPNSGETSMGFMLIDSLIMKLLGEALAPLIIKLLGLLSLYAAAALTGIAGKQAGLRRPWYQIAAIAVLWLPGNAFAAMYGMENITFAALSCLFFYAILYLGWLDESCDSTLVTDCGLGLFAGVLFWFRPEALPLVGILLVFRIGGAIWSRQKVYKKLSGAGALLLLFTLSIAAYVVIFRHYSGEFPYGAGKARRLMSILNDSVLWHGWSLNLKVLARIAAYSSIVLPVCFISINAMVSKTIPLEARLKMLAPAMIFFVFLAAYVTNLLPSAQFSRYSVFIWPFGLIAMAFCLQTLIESDRVGKLTLLTSLSIISLGFAGAVAYETYLRSHLANGRIGQMKLQTLEWMEGVPRKRAAISAEISELLDLPLGEPATLAYQEVQVRYELADNFTIVSLDGITDSRLLRYFCSGWIDHDGYLIDTKTDYVMEYFPNYNADKTKWSLADLIPLQVGQSVQRPGIVYAKIRDNIVRVQRTVSTASERPGGICGAGK